VATKGEVEAKLRELIARLAGAENAQGSLARSLPETKIIAVHIVDLDMNYWTEMQAGRMDGLHEGIPGRADIRIGVPSDELVAMVDGKASLFSAFLSGKVKIDASLSDMLRLRKLA
jgi:predicted lipid carrier protein YhbT